MFEAPALMDGRQRRISYLRLSVTDRCNLACGYCRTEDSFIPHDSILRFEEMERLVEVLQKLGIGKIRLTGGEPLVRRGLLDFLTRLRHKHPQLELCLTSNGLLLAPLAKPLTELGVRINLSLDSLRRARFQQITGQDKLHLVLQAIDAMNQAGTKFKINCVALKGMNDDELPDFLKLAQDLKRDLRFIEFMPMGQGTRWSEERFWSTDEIFQAASALVDLRPSERDTQFKGPARMFEINQGPARLGLISPLSNHFCAECNRLRVTSSGSLRACLFDDNESDLRSILRNPEVDDEELSQILRQSLRHKPLGSELLAASQGAVAQRAMTAIGG